MKKPALLAFFIVLFGVIYRLKQMEKLSVLRLACLFSIFSTVLFVIIEGHEKIEWFSYLRCNPKAMASHYELKEFYLEMSIAFAVIIISSLILFFAPRATSVESEKSVCE